MHQYICIVFIFSVNLYAYRNRLMKTVKRNIYIYICAFLLPLIMAQVYFAICGLYPYGPSSVLTGDMDVEFANFFSYYINTFHNKNDFSYMLAKTLGGDFPGLAAFQLHDPLLLLLFFFQGDRVAYGIEFVFSIQISLAGLFMSILLNRRYRSTWMSLLFSTAYAFIAFFFGYFVLMIYFTCIALLPLIMYYLLEFLDERMSSIPLIIACVLHIYINYHMGFMLVIFLALVYVSRVIADTKYIKKLRDFVLAGVTVLLIDGFFLIRTGLSLIGEKTTDTANYGFFRNFQMNQLFANLFSGSTRNQNMPLMHCTIAAMLFAIIYFISKEYGIREKLANAFLLCVVCISMWINTFDSVWHGFNNPEEFYFRYAYLVSLMTVVLGYKGFISLYYSAAEEAVEWKKGRVKVLAATGLLVLYMVWLILTKNVYFDRERQIVNAVIVLIAALAAYLASIAEKGYLRIWGFILLIAVSVPDMLYDARTSFIRLNGNDGKLPEMERFKEDYRRIGEAVDYIKSRDDGFYRIEKDFDRAVNDAAMFDYIGLSHDSSCEKDAVNDYLMNYGFTRMPYYTFYNGGSTSFSDAVLGVRYLISERGDDFHKPYEYMDEAGDYRVYRDQYALPMAYIAPAELKDFSFDKNDNTFEKQNKLAKCWGISEDLYKKADFTYTLEGAEETEPGHFVRTEDEGYIVYDLSVMEDMPLYIFFRAPHLQSGEVFVNGDSYGWYFTERQWNVLCAGSFKQGDKLEIRMQILKEELEITEPCFYFEDEKAIAAWSEAAAVMDQGIGGVDEITSSHLRFNAETADGQIVVMTIPYDTSWHIKCDGKRIEPVPATELLMGMELPEGTHEIEMKYIPLGTVPGLIVSIIGLILFGVQIHIEHLARYFRA